LTANQTVPQISVTSAAPADVLKIESGVSLTVSSGTPSGASINQEILVLGTLNVTGGTFTVNNGNLAGSGTIALAGGNMTFTNNSDITVQTNISVDWGSGSINTLTIDNSANITLSAYAGSTEPLIKIGANGIFNITVDDNTSAIYTDDSISSYTPIDLQGTLNKGGTVASSPNNYFQIAAPIFVDGSGANMNIQAGDGLYFGEVQGETGSGNRGQAVYQTGGTIKLNNGSTLTALGGMQMDGGTLTGYSTVTNGTASTWTVQLGTGDFIFNGGTINMGGTDNGGSGAFDYGTFNVSTGSDFLWYNGTLNVSVYSGGGANNGCTSGLAVVGSLTIESGNSPTMALTGGNPNASPYAYAVMWVSGVGNTITANQNPAPSGWTGSVNGVDYDISY
jgi:hypothetical protein